MRRSKQTAKQAGSGSTAATSKPPFTIRLTERLRSQLKALSRSERKAIGEAINAVQDAWGQPHQHRGIGIRRLRQNVFECRVNLDLRLAFVVIIQDGELVFFAVGNHDFIAKLIKTL